MRVSSRTTAKLVQVFFFNRVVFQKLSKVKVKKKIKARMIRVIKKTFFHRHRWINDLLYHLGSLEVYSIAALNAQHRSVSK
jgi:hypothetical protein